MAVKIVVTAVAANVEVATIVVVAVIVVDAVALSVALLAAVTTICYLPTPQTTLTAITHLPLSLYSWAS